MSNPRRQEPSMPYAICLLPRYGSCFTFAEIKLPFTEQSSVLALFGKLLRWSDAKHGEKTKIILLNFFFFSFW